MLVDGHQQLVKNLAVEEVLNQVQKLKRLNKIKKKAEPLTLGDDSISLLSSSYAAYHSPLVVIQKNEMGIDSSQYRLKENESLESILAIIASVCKNIYEPKFTATITSKSIDQIKKISTNIEIDLLNLGIGFTSTAPKRTTNEIANSSEEIRTLSISIPYDQKESVNSIHLSYSREIKNSSAYIGLGFQDKRVLIDNLSQFLFAINEYSEFGPENESEIKELAKTLLNLNSNVIGQNQWIYKTGCIDFEPSNENRVRTKEKTYKSLSGIKVQFSKIHAMAYKAQGSIKVLNELAKLFDINKLKVNLTTDSIDQISILENSKISEYYCNFYYNFTDVNIINDIAWAMENNEYSIVLEDAKLDKESNYKFNVYLSGNSIENLEIDMFIDVDAPQKYKDKVLNLFENRFKYIGDG